MGLANLTCCQWRHRKPWIRREGHWRFARTPRQGLIIDSSRLRGAGDIFFLWCFCSVCGSWRLRELYREVHERHPVCSGGGQPDHQLQVLHSSARLLPRLPRSSHWRHSMAGTDIWNDHFSHLVLVCRSGEHRHLHMWLWFYFSCLM